MSLLLPTLSLLLPALLTGRHQGLLRPAPHRRHRLPRGAVPGRLDADAQAGPLARLRLRPAPFAEGRRPGADAGGPVGPGQEPGHAGRGERDCSEEAEPLQGEGGEGGGYEREAEAGEEEVGERFPSFCLCPLSSYFAAAAPRQEQKQQKQRVAHFVTLATQFRELSGSKREREKEKEISFFYFFCRRLHDEKKSKETFISFTRARAGQPNTNSESNFVNQRHSIKEERRGVARERESS